MTGQAEEKRCFALAERLQKLIAAAGLCSRRTAEEWIAAGRVRVNGETATVGQSADPETDTICVDGVPVTPPERRAYLMLNKPRGYVTTLSDERGRPTAAELVADCGTRVYPVGRLDLDSEGLLLFTNDGAWMQRILHPSHEIEKTYEVTVAGAVENAAAELAAVRSALNNTAKVILKDHVEHCLADAVEHGDMEAIAQLDRAIEQYARGWKTSRISRSAAAVLRCAMCEILYMPDVPDAAAINEAVELAKKYEDADTVAFINGVLGAFQRAEKPAEIPAEE